MQSMMKVSGNQSSGFASSTGLQCFFVLFVVEDQKMKKMDLWVTAHSQSK
jgi:hypothetical protein